jgi:hypothetical protein
VNALAGLVLGFLWFGGPRVPTEPNLAFHWTPGVWFMLLRADADHQGGIRAEITDPQGKVLCPANSWSPEWQVKNRCDCMAFSLGPREGSNGATAVSISAWRPQRGFYRIKVVGLRSCRVSVMAGAQFSPRPHWGEPDTLSIRAGDEHVWLATWDKLTSRDSCRVTLRRADSLQTN